jgi:hypothetical protein
MDRARHCRRNDLESPRGRRDIGARLDLPRPLVFIQTLTFKVGQTVTLSLRDGREHPVVVVRLKAPHHVQVRFTRQDGETADSWRIYPRDFVRRTGE